MIKVKKSEKESTERFFQRFSGKVQKSRIMLKKKASMFFQKSMNKRKVREMAVKREHYRAERERKKFY